MGRVLVSIAMAYVLAGCRVFDIWLDRSALQDTAVLPDRCEHLQQSLSQCPDLNYAADCLAECAETDTGAPRSADDCWHSAGGDCSKFSRCLTKYGFTCAGADAAAR